ncbi:MAG: hypothetical protein LBG29_07165 [Synergistaceae bacterium]|jgi:uncharacterized protein with PIN domain|nr:hypothetical protein [Synergistaceae bacterium]
MAEKKQKCCKCNLYLEPSKTTFIYLGQHFSQELPRCPSCGQMYISEEMVECKIAEIEQVLEEK